MDIKTYIHTDAHLFTLVYAKKIVQFLKSESPQKTFIFRVVMIVVAKKLSHVKAA